MKKYALLIVFIARALAQQDLGNKGFLFPKEGATAHVILYPEVSKPLDKLTVCVRSYTELAREHPLFSLALKAPGKDNTFLIFPRPPNFCSVYINQEEIRIKIDQEVLDWKHTCVSWDSGTGVIQLWVNGKLYPRKVSNKGFTIPVPYSIILGQEQDSFGGGFDAKQSFMGELTDVHMWDSVLDPEDIQAAQKNYNKNGNLISWTSLKYEAHGDTLVLPKLQYLGNKVFLFSNEGATAHVILYPEVSKPLDKLTVCVWSYTELAREHPLFSLALKGSGKDNTFLIFPKPPNFCSVYINQEEIRIKIDQEVLDWKHTCVSWDSGTGVIQLWVNGKLYPRKVSNKGFTIPVPYSIILGQEQDSFGSGFDAKQSFMGEITDVHMWDSVLSPEDIRKVLSNENSGNVISWNSVQYESKGGVLLQSKLHCDSAGHTYRLYDQC